MPAGNLVLFGRLGDQTSIETTAKKPEMGGLAFFLQGMFIGSLPSIVSAWSPAVARKWAARPARGTLLRLDVETGQDFSPTCSFVANEGCDLFGRLDAVDD